MDTDATRRAQSDRYREIAKEIYLLVSKMEHAEAAGELRLLALSYERLAEHSETGAPYPPQDIKEALP